MINSRKFTFIFNVLLFSFSALTVSCGDGDFNGNDRVVSLSNENKYQKSTTAGNLIATAMRLEYSLDVVLYPSAFLSTDRLAYVKAGMTDSEIENVLAMYPNGPEDRFLIGNMEGRRLKEFVFDRVSEKYTAELQTAGLSYDIRFTGGIPMVRNFAINRVRELKDDQFYKVAISNYFFFSGKTFPGYKFRNGMGNYSFKRFNDDLYSARTALRSYLKDLNFVPFLEEPRVNVVNNTRNQMFIGVENSARSMKGKIDLMKHPRHVRISKIQGRQHLSPYFGHKLVTSGIVTAVNNSQWYPWGIDLYIQSKTDDGDIKTSEGIHVHLSDEKYELELGDEIVLAGTVFEQMMHEGLSKTSIRNVFNLQVISKGNPLPSAIKVGRNGLKIPKDRMSSWVGNLNLRPELNLSDALDFWESLEGMRISIDNPRVLGFRGGAEELETPDNKDYISIFIRPDGDVKDPLDTQVGGIMIDLPNLDFNPEIMTIATHHLTRGVTKNDFFNVGDLIEGDLEGVFTFEKNIFGGGDFMLQLPEPEPEIQEAKIKRLTPLEDRPKFNYPANDQDQLSIAAYNLRNLAGNMPQRLNLTGQIIRDNFYCPDVVALVELQDDNGIDFAGGNTAEKTIQKIIQASDCLDSMNVDYQIVNIDPNNHKEGGQPGGNIRVALIYNSNKLKFDYRVDRSNPDPNFTYIKSDGSLSHNPGRIYGQHPMFRNTRKSIIAEFEYNGRKLFVVGNHLNSKLGDTSLFAAERPFYSRSEERRQPRANLINQFLQVIEKKNQGSLIAVAGDFNAIYTEQSMQMLAGRTLYNLITYNDLIPFNQRYTTNHNGNSQALDYIFINKELAKFNPQPQILHINSNYMGRLSDHDPFLARFDFNLERFENGRCGWKFLKRMSSFFKSCDPQEVEEQAEINSNQCIKQINDYLARSRKFNCYVDETIGETSRSFQFDDNYLIELIREIK